MSPRAIASRFAVVAGLTFLTASAHACVTSPCTPAANLPLQLGSFMRHPVAPTPTHAAKTASGERRVSAPLHKPHKLAVLPRPAPPGTALAYAPPSTPDVRVVTGDELNEIDRAAPIAAGPDAAASPVQVVDAGEINEIDRKATDGRGVPLDGGGQSADEPPSVEHADADDTLLRRAMAWMKGAYASTSAAVRGFAESIP